ncbi:MAG: zinc-ribbon domain-containing protein [Candidatus Heimdallarchaeota archaeon]
MSNQMPLKQKSMGIVFCPNCGTDVAVTDAFCQSCGQRLHRKPAAERPLPQKPLNKPYHAHIQIIGIVEILFGVFALIGAVFVGILAFFVPLIIENDPSTIQSPGEVHSGTEETWPIAVFVGVLLLVVAILLLGFAITAILSGKKLLEYKNSGRIGTMVVSGLLLFWFPFGTLLGVAALYYLTRPEVEQLYSKDSMRHNTWGTAT